MCSYMRIYHIIKGAKDSVCASGRSNGATAPLRVRWGGGRPSGRRGPQGPPRARSARRAAQRLGLRSDASKYNKKAASQCVEFCSCPVNKSYSINCISFSKTCYCDLLLESYSFQIQSSFSFFLFFILFTTVLLLLKFFFYS